MYQLVVLGLACTLFLGGAYYIKSADTAGILSGAISSSPTTTVLTEDVIAGTYFCDISSGCNVPYTLTLKNTGEADVVTSVDQADEVKQTGTWQLEHGQLINVVLLERGDTVYDAPHTLLIQSVSTSTLGKVSYDSTIFPDIHKPVFTRQSE